MKCPKCEKDIDPNKALNLEYTPHFSMVDEDYNEVELELSCPHCEVSMYVTFGRPTIVLYED